MRSVSVSSRPHSEQRQFTAGSPPITASAIQGVGSPVVSVARLPCADPVTYPPMPLQAPSRPGSLRFHGIMWPTLAMLLASPITVGALGSLPSSDGLLLVTPTVLAVAAAPGYLRAVLGWVSIPALSPLSRVWVRASFLAALIAAVIGAVIGLAFVLPSVAAVLSVTTLIVIWRRLEVRPAGHISSTIASR